MLSHNEADKARHYLDLLDTARCDGQWHEIPEITRKIGKHTPHRQCLIVTAQTERAVAEQFSKQKEPMSQPAQVSPVMTSLSQSIPALVNARDQEVNYKEDAFQAQVCLAWLYITLGQVAHALSTVPSGLDQGSERFARDGGIHGRWTHVCIMKGAYIRGVSLEKEGMTRDAYRTYESMLPYLSNLPSTFANTTQHHYWREMLLARYSMLSSRHVVAHAGNPIDLLSPAASIPPTSLLTSFRAYAHNWDSKLYARAGKSSFSLRPWQAYYDTLSILVQQGFVEPMFKSKLQQRTEVKIVETIYEDGLLKGVTFPRADQTSSQIESWVDQVMANWRIMCGSTWQEEELGEGGKAALGHGVLDILYRAATKTFHSTRLLRHLFTVHAALAEFYLASKALDSYLEILVKGKARIEKSGEDEVGLDDDATALSTAAAGIKMLCKYGRRKEAEKSLSVANVVEGWVNRWHPVSSPKLVVSAEDVAHDLLERPRVSKPAIPGKAWALGYHALGVSQACWARLTYETSSRSDLQAKAIANFRTALEPEFGDNQNVEILYSLSSVLAETRDLDAAIATVKQALSPGCKRTTNGVSSPIVAFDIHQDEEITNLDQRSLLVKCWHLLALLLSARQSFSTAVASCEAALELYGGKSILYGDTKPLDSPEELVLSERKTIIEIKMTQIALAEVIEGPEEAVNLGGELLGLYTTLFKYVDRTSPKVQEPSTSAPPSANGTLRSLRGSILGLPKDQGPKSRRTELSGQTETTTSSWLHSYEPPDEATRPPTISVTGEEGAVSENPTNNSSLLSRHVSNKLHKRISHKPVGSRRLSRNASPSRPTTSDGARRHLSLGLPHRDRHTEPTAIDGSGNMSNPNSTHYASDEVGVAISHDLPSIPASPAATSDPPNPLHTIPSATQNMNHRNPNTQPPAPKPPPSQHTRPSPLVIPSALAPLPEPHYSPEDEARHALTLLTRMWLLISSLYRRASMPADAQGALSEATTHVQSIETSIVARDGSSSESFSTPGYGSLKSSDELWADVLAEQAALHMQQEKVELASKAYESALGHWPDHVAATVGLCNLLLDEYAAPPITAPSPLSTRPLTTSTPTLGSLPTTPSTPKPTDAIPLEDLLPKLAARDRAYGLLSALTKTGKGWDCSEAWYALARAYEEGGQVEKAKEALWWVVELEDGRGVRGWECAV